MSKYKEEILNIVLREGYHPTADGILSEMRSRNSKISQASVYNNLNALEQQGFIVRLTSGDGPDRFDGTKRHDHAVCINCGEYSDLSVHDLTGEIEGLLGQPIVSYELKINYLCEKCRKTGIK